MAGKNCKVIKKQMSGGDELPGISKVPGAKPIGDSCWATAVQIHYLLRKSGAPPITDAELRRLADINNPNPVTGRPWIPKPVRGKYELTPTLLGILAHDRSKANRVESARRVYQSQKDFIARTPYSAEMLAMLRHRGCQCVLPGGRIDEAIFVEAARPVLKAIFTCEPEQIASLGIDEFSTVNRNLEEGKLARERRIEIEMENARNSGRLHDLNEIEQRVRMEILQPARDRWQQIVKTYNRLKRTNPNIGNQLFEETIPEMLKEMGDLNDR